MADGATSRQDAAASTNGGSLSGRRIAALASDGGETGGLGASLDAFRAAGLDVHLVSLDADALGDEPGGEQAAGRSVDAVTVSDYQALVLPATAAEAKRFGADERVRKLVRAFVEHDRPVAALGAGAALLVASELVRGRTLTSDPSLAASVRDAGGEWVDEGVVVDQKLVTGRGGANAADFAEKLLSLVSDSVEESLVDRQIEQTFPASDPVSWTPTITGKMNERRDMPRADAPPG